MSLEACIKLVEHADPDRFTAAQLAPVEVQKILFPLYAFNVEVSRAPWLTEEPMIAEMRLQWWRDVLDEISTGNGVRAHEVATALAGAIDPCVAQELDSLVAARRWDIYRDPFEDEAHLLDYLDKTSGYLMRAAAQSLGASSDILPDVMLYGRGVGLARFLQAVPELEARGRVPLLNGTHGGVARLVKGCLASMPDHKGLKKRLGPAGSVLTEGWQARAILKQAIKDPSRVVNGALGLSEFSKRWRLLFA